MLSAKVLIFAAFAFLSAGECGRVKRQDLIPFPRLGKRGGSGSSTSSATGLTLPYREGLETQGLRVLPILLPISADGTPIAMSSDASRTLEESEVSMSSSGHSNGRPVSSASSSSSPAASTLFLRRLAHRLLQEPLVAAAAAEYPRMADTNEVIATGYGQ